MMRVISAFLAVLMVCGVASATSWGAEWGDLDGQIIFDGVPPIPEKANITSDKEVCCEHDVIVESLLVDAKSKGVQNVIIVLTQSRTDKREVLIHESYEELKKKPVRLDNAACRFDPHVALVWTGQKVVIGNSDPIGHNVNLTSNDSEAFNETVPSGGTIEKSFAKGKRMPVSISCSIHPWMKGWVVIRETPYMAVTDKDGKFEIKNLPVGKWQFMFWQEAAGYVAEVKRNGQVEEWRRGIVEVDIKPGKNSLGKIVVGPELFEK